MNFCTNTKSALVDGIYRTNTILGGSHTLASKKNAAHPKMSGENVNQIAP
jgi:hypothetical protein